jgi:hypothetical protein
MAILVWALSIRIVFGRNLYCFPAINSVTINQVTRRN